MPNSRNYFCIEVKNYKDSPLTDKIFTQPKTNNIIRWWKKLVSQAEGGNQKPLLFFKYDRSKVFVCTEMKPLKTDEYLFVKFLNCYILLAEEWLEKETIEFAHGF